MAGKACVLFSFLILANQSYDFAINKAQECHYCSVARRIHSKTIWTTAYFPTCSTKVDIQSAWMARGGGEQCQLCLAFSKGRSNQLLPIAKTSSPVQTLFYVYIPNMGTLDFIFRLCQLFLPVKHRYFPILVGFFPSGAHSYLPTRAKWMLLITFLFMREFQKKRMQNGGECRWMKWFRGMVLSLAGLHI